MESPEQRRSEEGRGKYELRVDGVYYGSYDTPQELADATAQIRNEQG